MECVLKIKQLHQFIIQIEDPIGLGYNPPKPSGDPGHRFSQNGYLGHRFFFFNTKFKYKRNCYLGSSLAKTENLK
jgi:hypothetical protein